MDNNVTNQKIVSKTVFVYFMILNFGWGIDYGFIGLLSQNFRNVAHKVSILISIFVTLILLSPLILSPIENYWYFIFFLQYVIYVMILKLTKYTAYGLVISINKIDENIKELKSESLGIIAALYSFGLLIFKIILFYFYCFANENANCAAMPIPYYIYGIWYLSSDLVHGILIFINYCIYCYVKNLKSDVQNLIDAENILKRYEAIARCYDKITILYDSLVSVYRFFLTPMNQSCK